MQTAVSRVEKGRVEKAVFRVSCLVFRENLKGSGWWLVFLVYEHQDFVFRENLKGSG